MASQPDPLSIAEAVEEPIVRTVSSTDKAKAEQAIRESAPEYLAELHRRAVERDKTFSFEEALSLTSEDKVDLVDPQAVSQHALVNLDDTFEI